MATADYIILMIYGIGILYIGSILSKKNKTSADMFAVKKQSPWWLSGVSAFMSAFSAGTFVVWGGIAYKQGLVAVSICMCAGISSLIVGFLFAKKWASLGVTTVGEYVNMRFGNTAVQFYTWIGMIFKIIAMGVALYSFATLVSSLVPLSPANWLADPDTGKLSKSVAIIISGLLMLVYAVSGGLWAVLIIDAIQFVVLTATVLFVVPLCFNKVGGVSHFIASVPKDFLSPASGNFTFLFLLGWITVHTFKLGGEWVFVQRFLAVSSPKNAQKSSFLFGVLHLISPIVWMLPPMIYRVMNPNAIPEQAYVLACAAVLPAGMMGLLLAAMFSSAASYIDGEVNVYAGAVTDDFYKPIINPTASEKQLVLVGRISSFLIGAVIIGIALSIPYFGGAEKVILTITGLLAVAMVLPVLWGLYFGGITKKAVWYSSFASFVAAAIVKLAVPTKSNDPFISYFNAHLQVFEVAIGIFVPLTILSILELKARNISDGFTRVHQIVKSGAKIPNDKSIAHFPARILGFSIAGLSILMFSLSFTARERSSLILFFATVLMIIGAFILWLVRKPLSDSPAMVIEQKQVTIES
jgi:SSS family solute:Na+ symporter